MESQKKPVADTESATTVEAAPGIFRTTLSYNRDIMLCHFRLLKGTQIPLHNHAAVQNGYVISGMIRFTRKDGSSFIAGPGTAYVFDPHEYHGAEILEETVAIECFSPMRPEYIDG
ncbi:MAG: cupin domain-containing protein [Spirochaetes bacterium]|nr:cupin domain-containing protein [Spirochaetota bacterium]